MTVHPILQNAWRLGILLCVPAALLTGCNPDQIGADKLPEAKGVLPAGAATARPAPAKANDEAMTDAPTETELGLSYYPGAKLVKSSGGSNTSRALGILTTVLETPDPLDKVSVFYEKDYPKVVRPEDKRAGKRYVWSEKTEQGTRTVNLTIVDAIQGNGMRHVQISLVGGKTRIELMRVQADHSSRDIYTDTNPFESSRKLPATTSELGSDSSSTDPADIKLKPFPPETPLPGETVPAKPPTSGSTSPGKTP